MRGNTKDNLGDHNGAIEDYTKGIKINPTGFKSARLYANRANVRNFLGDYIGAIEDYTMALKFEKWSPWYIGLGDSKFNLNDIKSAILEYSNAIKVDPENSNAYYKRGLAKYELNDFKASLDDFTYSISIDGKNHLALLERGKLLFELDKPFDAIGDLNRAIDIEKNDYQSYFYRAMIKISFGQEGCEDLRKSLDLSKNIEERKKIQKKLLEHCN